MSQVGVEESTLITKQWISIPQPGTTTHAQVTQGVMRSGRIHAVPSLFTPSSLSCFGQVVCHTHEKIHDDYSIFCGNTMNLRTGLANMAAS